jgi:hypothetical protein
LGGKILRSENKGDIRYKNDTKMWARFRTQDVEWTHGVQLSLAIDPP